MGVGGFVGTRYEWIHWALDDGRVGGKSGEEVAAGLPSFLSRWERISWSRGEGGRLSGWEGALSHCAAG